MKKLLYLLVLLAGEAMGQNTTALPGGTVPVTISTRVKAATPDSLSQYWDFDPIKGKYNRRINFTEFNAYVGTATAAAIAASSPPVSGVITSSPTIGQTFASLNGFIALFSQTNNPTGGLSGGNNYQRSITAATHNLSYSYGRTNLNTNPIISAVINPGSFNVFSSTPAQGSSNSGTQSVTTPSNTNRTYTITITTSDSKTASYSTSDNWYGNAYYGRAAGTSATSGEVLASAGGGSPLAGSHAGSWTVTSSGSNHPFIAIPATLGHITQFLDVNNFDVTSSFPETSLSITNASGYTETYYCYTFVTSTSSNYFFTTN